MIINILLAILGFVLLMIVSLLWYGLHDPNYDISPSNYPWKKGMTKAEIEQETQAILAKMTLTEKAAQLTGGKPWFLARIAIRFALFKDRYPFNIVYSGKNDRLNIPPLAFSDGPRGVTIGHSTGFPVAIARGASWDVELEKQVADIIGKECRALNANYFAGLCVNLLRHPAWGRAQETYGEDSFLLGEFGLALMQGVQAHQVMACAKHFAANSIENSRFYVDVKMNERTLHEVYLPHFKKLVDNDLASLMNAYNKINGTYCGHNYELLTQILRIDWGFEGFVSSDFIWGVYDVEKGIPVGMDVEMPVEKHYSLKKIKTAIQKGTITQAQIDESVKRVVSTKLKFINKADTQAYPKDLVACQAHRDIARISAEKSMVLLKNEKELLPLSKKVIKKIAVIGELAKEKNTGDKGSSYVKPPYVVTILEGTQNYLSDTAEVIYHDGKEIAAAKKIAESADAVLIVAGYRYNDEGEYVINDPEKKGQRAKEGGDRERLTLRKEEEQLIKAVATANPITIVSLIGGSAIIMENWKKEIPAILMAWYPGMEGGNALARILFGEVNPSGKLPFIIPTKAKQLPAFDAFADDADYGYYHGYTLFDKKGIEPAFPFGYGLSYTQFECKNLAVKQEEINHKEIVEASVTIQNIGHRDGEEVCQLYIGFKNSQIDRPLKLLKGFQKINIPAGESKTLHFQVSVSELAYYNPTNRTWEMEDMEYEIYMGSSADWKDLLSANFQVKRQSLVNK